VTRVRILDLVALTTFVAVGVGLFACGGDDVVPASREAGREAGAPPPAAPPVGDAAAAARAGTNLQRPAFASAAECGTCHREIYEEWKASWHGQAMTDPLFLRLSDGLKQEECIRCHAPVPLREAESWETPIARSDRREDAVSCLTCHQAGGRVTGPFDGMTGACRPVYDPAQRDPTKMCFGCHNQHKTGEEWLAGPYAPEASPPRQREAQTCLDCHMPWVDRPLVPGGPVRRGRRHTWPGGHDMSQLRRAAKLEVETTREGEGTRVRTWVTNVGAGHNIPTDARHRSFDVYVKVWDESGKVVLDPLDPDPAKQRLAQTAKYRLNYRNSNLPDTQIAPLERVSGLPRDGSGPGSWRGYVDVPVRKGRGEAWLVYRLTPEDVLVAESLTDPSFQPYRARRVETTTFEFGE
jgi:nitrate/TMAO reductase-like tetraheme cytochrome c subunit